MTERPYFRKTVAELAALFAAGAADPNELKRLSEELTHRHVPKAVNLLARVKKAIEALKAGQVPPKQDNSTQNTAKQAAYSSDETTHKIIPCKVCAQKLRVPLTTGTFTCPACKAEFKATFENGVFALVFARPANESRPGTGVDGEPMTLDSAYALFEANEKTSWEAIEGKRRKLLQQYHPDKVASLGPKLRTVAEAEGKRINVAYALMRQARGY